LCSRLKNREWERESVIVIWIRIQMEENKIENSVH
jgi:hypothetical protein